MDVALAEDAVSRGRRRAAAHFLTLDRSFEDTTTSCYPSRSETLHERAIEAKRLYARCRDVDPPAPDGMDGYAELMYTHFATTIGIRRRHQVHAADADAYMGGFGVLSTGFGFPERRSVGGLARLARTSRRRIPIGPIVGGVGDVLVVKGRLGARRITPSALRADDRHAGAHAVKGHVCLSLRRADAAVSAFRRAAALAPSVVCYAGLVAGYILQRRLKEAMGAAKEAVRIAPNSAKALALLGDVHRQSGDGVERARKAYEQSLRADSSDAG